MVKGKGLLGLPHLEIPHLDDFVNMGNRIVTAVETCATELQGIRADLAELRALRG